MEAAGVVMTARMAESNQMSLATEKRFFEKDSAERKQTPCTLITGWLGSGKTTLVQHILRMKGDLRVAVLVNEFGELDVDSLLLSSRSVGATLGLPAMRLAAGCACCSISADLKSAVKQIMDSEHQFDHLVIETSGVADPQPIAAMLEELSVKLSLIVTVVDVEAVETILHHPVAKNQLCLADLVLINKCDLVRLGTISDVEDRVEAETGGTRALRCRFCEVPLPLVLDVAESIAAPISSASGDSNVALGFMSHERVSAPMKVSVTGAAADKGATDQQRKRNAALRGSKGRGPGTEHADPLGVEGNGSKHARDGGGSHEGCCSSDTCKDEVHRRDEESSSHASAAHEEAAFVSRVVECREPLSLVSLQDFITKKLRPARGLFRAKGLVWVSDDRRGRYVLQWSGRQRAEVVCQGQWETEPSTQIVLIGRDNGTLSELEEALLACQARPGLQGASALGDDTPDSGKREASDSEGSAPASASSALASLMAKDSRFKVSEGPARGEAQSQRKHALVDTIVRFGLVGKPLRGIHEPALNSALMRDVNASGRAFLSAATPLHQGNLLQIGIQDPQQVEAVWSVLSDIADRVLIRAHSCNPGCRCGL